MEKSVTIVLGIMALFWAGAARAAEPEAEVSKQGRHMVLSLSEKQVAEVEKTRRFTLSREQLEALRESAPDFPKQVGVVSPFVELIPDSKFSPWPGQISGIWWSRNEVGIPENVLQGSEGCRGFSTDLGVDGAVLIDTDGRYWIGSRQVNTKKLIRSLDDLEYRQAPGQSFGIFVLRPPVLEDEQEIAVQSAVLELEALCQERGLYCQLGG